MLIFRISCDDETGNSYGVLCRRVYPSQLQTVNSYGVKRIKEIPDIPVKIP